MTSLVKATPFFEAEAAEIRSLFEAWRTDFQRGFDRIFKIGEMLKQVKAEMPHGAFIPWVEKNCPFEANMAQKYMKMYEGRALINAECIQHLGIEAAMKLLRGQGSTDGQRKPAAGETCGAKELEALIARGKKFGTIYADPPWPYENQATRASTEKHYSMMTLEDIASLPIPQLTEAQAHLHLWTTNAFLYQTAEILRAWGFEYKGVFVWAKGRVTDGRAIPQIGIGNYWRVSHEFMVLGVKGGLCFEKAATCPSWVLALRGKHSAKPEAVRRLIERASPPERLELFARNMTDGWTSWGNEIDSDLFYRELEAPNG